MSDEQTDTLSPISFTFDYAGHGWAHASISDGVTSYDMVPSYVPQDPLFGLVAAVDKVLTYGGEAECTWDYEPAVDHWRLRRDGDALHITIRGERDVYFATTCDLWKFAAKLRTVVSRLQPVEEQYHDPTGVRMTPEYRVLCAYLEEHKRAQRARRSPRPRATGDDLRSQFHVASSMMFWTRLSY